MNKVSENPLKNREGGDMLLVIVSALFVTAYLVSNIMAVKVIGIFDLFYFDSGTITFWNWSTRPTNTPTLSLPAARNLMTPPAPKPWNAILPLSGTTR